MNRTNLSKKGITRRVLLYETCGFSLLILIILADEVFDLPYLLMGAAATPINWTEAAFECSVAVLLFLAVAWFTKSDAQLKQAEKLAAVGRLAAGMAHSIRNPLTAVKMRLYSLKRSLDLTDSQCEDFSASSQALDHIEAIIKNFLAFSRPGALQRQLCSPSAVIDRALQLIEHKASINQIELALERHVPLPQTQIDTDQLQAVFVNIISNALEAIGSKGRIVIREQTIERKPLGQVAAISFIDNGPGIPREITKKIFQPFFSSKPDGTGLGLSICERIISDHNGLITVASEQNCGATFTVYLPLAQEA